MEKLKSLSRNELQGIYYDTFGTDCGNSDKETLLAAIYHGKRVDYLTQEEIDLANQD